MHCMNQIDQSLVALSSALKYTLDGHKEQWAADQTGQIQPILWFATPKAKSLVRAYFSGEIAVMPGLGLKTFRLGSPALKRLAEFPGAVSVCRLTPQSRFRDPL